MQVIQILIADDHAIVREGLRALISTEPGMRLVGEAVDGVDAVAQARTCKPDVILLDLAMPQMDGLTAISEIRATNPDARILVLTSFAEDHKIFRALKAGAQGFMLKDSSPQELLTAIRDIYNGESPLHPKIAHRVVSGIQQSAETPAQDALTDREIEVLRWITKGLPNEEIAEKLVVSERTVRAHIGNILEKLHLTNRTQAALYALREGLASLDDS